MAPLFHNLQSKIIFPLLIFISALIFRIGYLNLVPLSLSHDEVDTVIQAHSVRLFGSDLNSSWHPLSLLPNDGVMGELVPLIHSFALSIFSNSLFSARITSVFLSSLYPLIIYYLLTSLKFSSRTSLFSSLLFVISPWHILFSRSAMEQPTSLFFYTLSWIFLSQIFAKKNLKPILLNTFSFFIFYIIGYFTYHGYKFSLPIISLIISVYSYLVNQSVNRFKLFIIFLSIITIGCWPLYFKSHYESRGSELAILNSTNFSKVVDSERRISVLPFELNQLFSNKISAYSQFLLNKMMVFISPDTIFIRGEGGGVFGTNRTGYLYLISLPFLLLGLSLVIIRRHYQDYLLLVFLIFSPLSSLLHQNNSFAFRSAFYIVVLTILTASGIDYFVALIKSRVLLLCIVCLYALSFSHFLYIYYGFYATESAHEYFLGDRLLGNYLKIAPKNAKILVIDSQPRYIASYYILAHSIVSNDLLSPLRGKYLVDEAKNDITLGNITIRRNCPENWEDYDTVIVDPVIAPGLSKCLPNLPRTALTYPLDSSVAKYIFGDKLCLGQKLEASVYPKTLAELKIDGISSEEFCAKWMTSR